MSEILEEIKERYKIISNACIMLGRQNGKTLIKQLFLDQGALLTMIDEYQKENQRLKVFITLHGLDKVYKEAFSDKTEEQLQEFLRVNNFRTKD